MKIILSIFLLLGIAQAQLIAMGKPKAVAGDTWTAPQIVASGACNAASPSLCTVGSSTIPAGDVLAIGLVATSSVGITSVTAAACTSSWTHAANTLSFVAADGGLDMYYCLNSASRTGTIVVTIPNNANGFAVLWRFHNTVCSSGGTCILDTGATPSNKINDAACTTCAGVSLTLAGTNDAIASIAGCGDTCSNLAGTGWTNDLANPSGDGAGHGLNVTSMSMTWTQTSSATLSASAIAFKTP